MRCPSSEVSNCQLISDTGLCQFIKKLPRRMVSCRSRLLQQPLRSSLLCPQGWYKCLRMSLVPHPARGTPGLTEGQGRRNDQIRDLRCTFYCLQFLFNQAGTTAAPLVLSRYCRVCTVLYCSSTVLCYSRYSNMNSSNTATVGLN